MPAEWSVQIMNEYTPVHCNLQKVTAEILQSIIEWIALQAFSCRRCHDQRLFVLLHILNGAPIATKEKENI